MKMLTLIGTMVICSTLYSQTLDDKKEIQAVFKKLNAAWEAHDYAYSEYDILDSNAVLINPVGMYWRNKEEITKGLTFLGQVRFKYLKIVADSIMNIRFLSSNVALMIAYTKDVVTQDFTMPGTSVVTKKGEISEGMQSYTLIRNGNGWKITSIHITHIDSNLSSPK